MVIGNYHFHPGEQAEFRSQPYDESKMMKEIGVSKI